MGHTTEIINHEQVNDECLAVTIRCCGDTKTDSTTTISAAHTLTAEQIEASVDAHHDLVARKHTAINAAKNHLQNMKLKSKEHPAG